MAIIIHYLVSGEEKAMAPHSSTLATWFEELSHLKRPWCWDGWKAGGEEEDRGWDGWMASLTWWTWVWASSRSWWWTGKPVMLQSKRSQRVGHDWATELKWFCLYVWQNYKVGTKQAKFHRQNSTWERTDYMIQVHWQNSLREDMEHLSR